MKTYNKRITSIIGVLVFVMAVVQGCSDVAGPENNVDLIQNLNSDIEASALVCTISGSSTLKASKRSYDAGTVEYEIVGDNLIVTYVPAAGVTISETHLWVGTDINDMPAAGNGAPKNGHFPYNDLVNTIPLADIDNYSPDNPLYIVAHAVVEGSQTATFKKEETAYAGEEEGDSKRWFWYIEFTQEEECIITGGGIGGTGGGNR